MTAISNLKRAHVVGLNINKKHRFSMGFDRPVGLLWQPMQTVLANSYVACFIPGGTGL